MELIATYRNAGFEALHEFPLLGPYR